MPHGLSVDAEENLWLTDVAMHQVRICLIKFDLISLFDNKKQTGFQIFKW